MQRHPAPTGWRTPHVKFINCALSISRCNATPTETPIGCFVEADKLSLLETRT